MAAWPAPCANRSEASSTACRARSSSDRLRARIRNLVSHDALVINERHLVSRVVQWRQVQVYATSEAGEVFDPAVVSFKFFQALEVGPGEPPVRFPKRLAHHGLKALVRESDL